MCLYFVSLFVVYEGCQHVTHCFVLFPWLLHLFCSFCPSLLLSLPSVTGDWQLWGLRKTCQPLLIWTVKGDWEKSRYGPVPSSAPWAYANTHMHTVIICSHWLLCFLTEIQAGDAKICPVFVFVLTGSWRSLCHLSLPWWQQLLCPYHPGVCDDVTARGCGGCSLLWALPKISTPSSHSAHYTCMVPRAAAGLGRRRPRLGLSKMNHEVLRVRYANSQGDQRVRSIIVLR